MPVPPTNYRWLLEDFSVIPNQSYRFELNPEDGGTENYERAVLQQRTSSPDGGVMLFEGRATPRVLEFTGTILTESQYNNLLFWVQKRHPVKLTDDLGRVRWIVFTSFTPTRKRSAIYPYKHSYTMKATLVETVA